MNESTAKVVGEIGAERQRQIDEEGWDSAHDDQHDAGELAAAGAAYAFAASKKLEAGIGNHVAFEAAPRFWPWATKWWKPKRTRHDLIRAAALIVAEIEKLDRAS